MQLLRMVNYQTDYLDAGKNIDVLYLDFQKAFDKVPHKRLMYKLEAYGVTGAILNWIESFLTNRRQEYVVEDQFLPGPL